MHLEARQIYNSAFTKVKYEAFMDWIAAQYDHRPPFKVAETPVFIPKGLKDKLFEACELINDVIVAPNFKQLSKGAIPTEYEVPNETDHTTFLQLDFGICLGSDGELTPQLIEAQGFPSLYFYQDLVADAYRRHFFVPAGFSHLFNGLDSEAYIEKLRRILIGDTRPENVVILEIEPLKQITAIDFIIGKVLLGLEIVCISEVRKEGRDLYYINDQGKKVGIQRIYNRVIFDELVTRPDILNSEFKLTDDVDVEWIGHPNWFFRISKHTLPILKNPYVPESFLLTELDSLPDDLYNYVLKPLFSFSGTGVRISFDEKDIEALPNKGNYLIQRKVAYEPVVETLDVPAKCEIRMLMLWERGEPRPLLVNNLVRLSKGEMIGVRYNKDKTWVGGSVGFFEM